jgi:hypothetical protein
MDENSHPLVATVSFTVILMLTVWECKLLILPTAIRHKSRHAVHKSGIAAFWVDGHACRWQLQHNRATPPQLVKVMYVACNTSVRMYILHANLVLWGIYAGRICPSLQKRSAGCKCGVTWCFSCDCWIFPHASIWLWIAKSPLSLLSWSNPPLINTNCIPLHPIASTQWPPGWQFSWMYF